MSIRTPVLVSVLLILAMAAGGFWAWSVLPDHALVAVHWGLNGKPNGFADKSRGFLMLPAVAAGVSLLLAAIPRIEPRRFNLAASARFYRAVWIGTVLVLSVGQATIVATALHAPIDVGPAVLGAVSVLFIVIGNYLGKTRSNFFAGVRTPWTLSSEYSWEKTHRLAGRLFVAVGIVTLIALAAFGSKIASYVFLPALVGTIVLSVVMSYFFWRRDPDKDSRGAIPQ